MCATAFIEQKAVLHNKTPSFTSYIGIADLPAGQTVHSVTDNWFLPRECSWGIRTFSVIEYFLLEKGSQSSKMGSFIPIFLKCHKQSKNCPISTLFLIHRKKKNYWKEQSREEKKNLGKNSQVIYGGHILFKILAQLLLWDNCFKTSQICYIWLEFTQHQQLCNQWEHT